MAIKKEATPLRRLLEDIGMNVIIDFCVDSFPGLVLDTLDSISGTFRALFKFRDKTSEFLANVFYGTGREGQWSREELINIELHRVRCAKIKGFYKQALNHVNAILAIEPDFPEALLLKAQILWEGFGNAGAAQAHLEKLMCVITDKNDRYYRWARNFYDELSQFRKDENHFIKKGFGFD